MKKAQTMFYGTITTEERNRSILESMGVEVGDYDSRRGFFYARATKQAVAELDEYGSEFKASLVAHKDSDSDTLRSVELLTTPQLKSERARLEWLVHSEPLNNHDADSCRWIEVWQDLLARVTDRLSDNLPAVRTQRSGQSFGMEM